MLAPHSNEGIMEWERASPEKPPPHRTKQNIFMDNLIEGKKKRLAWTPWGTGKKDGIKETETNCRVN